MSLVLGATWAHMTPEHITEEMTWHEVSSALEYVYRYIEPTASSVSGKKYKTIADYMIRGRDTFRDDIRKLRRNVEAK